ncbi:hypothetical protein DOM22_12955 [Bdellovibrio sp. ZAP7]|uniref:hypothetical protein n=1 Tax=Bdellovibrio sp. ZAP7 TaxID=2231053 RepID=UPI0011587B5B|nr:hypothetical protein [Bdellovibrio sp. ZAP7]QDK45996.1 hypothetical protein DOM22_12955 [Bdellovibrio sp. ZAP7]
MKLKLFILLSAVMMTSQGFAYTACVGETYQGKIVIVEITTEGTTGKAHSGSVTIADKGVEKVSYKLQQSEIVQYFEGGDTNNTMVGLAAYQAMNNPVWIMYKGINYHGDLVATLRDPARVKQPGNEMRVWRGPGFPADQQSQFTDVICNFSLDQ